MTNLKLLIDGRLVEGAATPGGSVWSGDPARALAVADRLESGTGADYGVEGLKQYTQTVVVRIAK